MMRIGCGVVFVGLVFAASCTKATTREPAETPVATNAPTATPPALAPPVMPPPVTPPPVAPPVTPPAPVEPPVTPPVTPAAASISVALAAVTLGDDCGVTQAPPAIKADAKMKREPSKADDADPNQGKSFAKAKRACEQTSMQLSVQAPGGGAPMALRIKHVELFDDAGATLGKLTPRSPTIWAADSTYQPWDQMIAPGATTKVSYSLSAPNWNAMPSRYNKTFVLKVTVTIGTKDQTVKKEVRIAAPTIMSPNVKT